VPIGGHVLPHPMVTRKPVNAVLPPPQLDAPRSAVDMLNSACFCFSLDQKALARALDSELGQPGLSEMVRQRCPFLFAALPVFVPTPQLHRMAQVMQAVESVAALPAYREQVLGAAPAIARLGTRGPLGAFFGYDFHLSEGHLGLIEINTNAGGAMLNAVLARAQHACCKAVDSMVPTLASVANFEQQIVAMFRHEWLLAGACERSRSRRASSTSSEVARQRRKWARQTPSINCWIANKNGIASSRSSRHRFAPFAERNVNALGAHARDETRHLRTHECAARAGGAGIGRQLRDRGGRVAVGRDGVGALSRPASIGRGDIARVPGRAGLHLCKSRRCQRSGRCVAGHYVGHAGHGDRGRRRAVRCCRVTIG
jgi:hypothetical protein